MPPCARCSDSNRPRSPRLRSTPRSCPIRARARRAPPRCLRVRRLPDRSAALRRRPLHAHAAARAGPPDRGARRGRRPRRRTAGASATARASRGSRAPADLRPPALGAARTSAASRDLHGLGSGRRLSRRRPLVRADFALRLPERSATSMPRRSCAAASSATARCERAGIRRGRACASASSASAPRRSSRSKLARHWGCRVFVCTRREGGAGPRARARRGVGGRLPTTRRPSRSTRRSRSRPWGRGRRRAAALDRGATVAINAIHLDRIPEFPYAALVGALIRSVANFTRQDAASSSIWPPRSRSSPASNASLSRRRTARSLESERGRRTGRP